MNSDEAKRLIEAGGIVPPAMSGNTLVDAALTMEVDTVTARAFRHRALDERVVVSLVPATLGPAEDLTMGFLGFALSGRPVEVGTGRRQALGFPAWAVVHDPVNGHHALALVKDVERLARMARTKPSLAKDGFVELAARLSMSVPHFLPTFFEQAGRAFLEADNKLSAAVMFDRAREAERFHGLAIDEDRQRDVFLEFALAGALAVKSLTRHAKDLAARVKPGEAYALFMRLCTERVAGGLPPYVAMAEDLRRLAKAAGLDVDSEEDRVLRSLLDSPSMPHAPMGFWKTYAPAVVRLAKADLGVKARLLDIFPVSQQPGVETMWLDLLDATGAVAGLVELEAAEASVARPRGGASGWLERAVQWRAREWSPGRSLRLLQLVARMAPQLRAESEPLNLWVKYARAADLDLFDLCSSFDLEIVVPDEVRVVSPVSWLQDRAPGRRDLAALVNAGWARELLLNGMNQVFARSYYAPPTEMVSLGQLRSLLENAGGRQLLAFWLRCLADDAESAALPGLEDVLGWLAPAALDVVLAVEPEAAARLAAVDTGRALARTLRVGLLDELGWPALDEVITGFPEESTKSTTRPVGGGKAFAVAHAWPVLMLVSQGWVTVVGAQGVLLRHDLRPEALLPARDGGWGVRLFWCDGQVLVSWQPTSGDCGYWSGKPSEVFDIVDGPGDVYGLTQSQTLPLPWGGRTGGGLPIMPGDRTFSELRPVAGDGTSWYRQEGRSWREFDPKTGNPGRQSLPDFFEGALAGGEGTLVDDLCFLAPVPPELTGSPFGTADGLLGWRVVVLPDGSKVGESVDGAVVRLSKDQVRRVRSSLDRVERRDDPIPAGALQLPGGGPRVGVLKKSSYVSLWDGHVVGSRFGFSGLNQPYARGGTATVPPVAWWHALRPRDVKGSTALRAVTDDQGRALVALAAATGSGTRPGSGGGEAAVREVLPEVTDPNLIAGIAGVLEIAVTCARKAQALPAPALGRGAAPATPPEEVADRSPVAATPLQKAASDKVMRAALSGLSGGSGMYRQHFYYDGDGMDEATALSALRAAVAFVDRPSLKAVTAQPESVPKKVSPGESVRTPVAWSVVIGGLGAIALRAASESTPDEERNALVQMLEAVLDTPLAETDGCWREVSLVSTAGATLQSRIRAPGDVEAGTLLRTTGGSAVVLSFDNRWNGTSEDLVWTALEHAPSGNFGAVPGYTVVDSRTTSGWGGAERIRELLALLRTRGPAPWRPEAVAALVTATGMSRAQAALLLAGLPRIGTVEGNFLPKHTRETLGLKIAEAAAVLPGMTAFSPAGRMLLVDLAMPRRPADLWDRGPDVKALADTWVYNYGRHAEVPEDLLSELASAMKDHPGYLYTAVRLVQGLAEPDGCAWLTTDRRWSVVGGRMEATGDGTGFSGTALVAATSTMLWLAYWLPRQHPMRTGLPRAYQLLRKRLSNPDLLVATLWGSDFSGLRQAYGQSPAPLIQGQLSGGTALGKAGIIVERSRGHQLYVRPALLTGSDDPLLKAAGSSFDPETAALRLSFDPALERLLESLEDTSPGWAQDPLVSAPALVPMAQEVLGVEVGAARLYLQMLALPDPTDKNIRRWNGWSLVELKEATVALLGVGALVGGKRPGAGRSAFLPCGWLDVEPPMPSIEAWKVDLLGLVPDGRGPLGVTVPSVPISELFTNAWCRVSAGDGPRYEHLETRP